MKAQVLVIMPCYRDSACLEKVIPELQEVDASYRVLVVNDTALPDAGLDDLKSKYGIDVRNVPYNMGHQAAIVFGLSCALLDSKYDDVGLFVVMDSDGQDAPSAVPRMIDAMGCEKICVAQRTGKRPEGRRFALGYSIHKMVFRTAVGFVPDYGNFSVITRDIARQITISPSFDAVYSMSLHTLAPIVKYPTERRARIDGKSRIGMNGLVDYALSTILANLRTIALRLAFVSLAFSGLLVLVSVLITVAKFTLPSAYLTSNWATVICFGSAILALQFCSLCVLLFVLAASMRQNSVSQRLLARLWYAQSTHRSGASQSGELTSLFKHLEL